jgi:hypothetical protein
MTVKIKDISAANKTYTPIILTWMEDNEHVSQKENNYLLKRKCAVVQNSEVKGLVCRHVSLQCSVFFTVQRQ